MGEEKVMDKIKILVADDHENFRHVLTSFLKSQERVESVEEAVDGLDAIEKIEKSKPDLILMDIHMPRQNGIEATRIIKNRWPSLHVFMLSMDINEFYKSKMQEYADGFIIKSSMKNALISIIYDKKWKNAETLEAEHYAT